MERTAKYVANCPAVQVEDFGQLACAQIKSKSTLNLARSQVFNFDGTKGEVKERPKKLDRAFSLSVAHFEALDDYTARQPVQRGSALKLAPTSKSSRKSSVVHLEKWINQMFDGSNPKADYLGSKIVKGVTSKDKKLFGKSIKLNKATSTLDLAADLSKKPPVIKSLNASSPFLSIFLLTALSFSAVASDLGQKQSPNLSIRQNHQQSTSWLNELLVKFIVFLLTCLLLTNSVLFYKLWDLEGRVFQSKQDAQVPNQNLNFDDFLRGEIPQNVFGGENGDKKQPNNVDWLKILHKQEVMHQVELEKWHNLLGTATELLRQVSVGSFCQNKF